MKSTELKELQIGAQVKPFSGWTGVITDTNPKSEKPFQVTFDRGEIGNYTGEALLKPYTPRATGLDTLKSAPEIQEGIRVTIRGCLGTVGKQITQFSNHMGAQNTPRIFRVDFDDQQGKYGPYGEFADTFLAENIVTN